MMWKYFISEILCLLRLAKHDFYVDTNSEMLISLLLTVPCLKSHASHWIPCLSLNPTPLTKSNPAKSNTLPPLCLHLQCWPILSKNTTRQLVTPKSMLSDCKWLLTVFWQLYYSPSSIHSYSSKRLFLLCISMSNTASLFLTFEWYPCSDFTERKTSSRSHDHLCPPTHVCACYSALPPATTDEASYSLTRSHSLLNLQAQSSSTSPIFPTTSFPLLQNHLLFPLPGCRSFQSLPKGHFSFEDFFHNFVSSCIPSLSIPPFYFIFLYSSYHYVTDCIFYWFGYCLLKFLGTGIVYVLFTAVSWYLE